MKKKLVIFAIILLIIIFSFITARMSYNNIEDDWILAISPIYLDSPSNTVYIYDGSYIITIHFGKIDFMKYIKEVTLYLS